MESYIAVALLRRDGSHFGTLCALDPNPSRLTETHFDIFRMLALLISYELEAQDEQQQMQLDLTAARELAQSRERLIAVLSHDLRTPLNAVLIGAEQLASTAALTRDEQQVAMGITGSARRATRMVGDLLDFTRARLGGGIPVRPGPADLSLIAAKVVSEVRAGNPSAVIEMTIDGDCRGRWDADRAAQVVSNILGNAVHHGSSDSIAVRLHGRAADVILEVENAAPPLVPEDLLEVFSPFRRSSGASGTGNLGLGLYIVQQIMHAHRGSVELAQSDGRIKVRTIWPRDYPLEIQPPPRHRSS